MLLGIHVDLCRPGELSSDSIFWDWQNENMSANKSSSSTTRAQASNVGLAKSKLETETSTKPKLQLTIIETSKLPADFEGDKSEGTVFYWCKRYGDL